MRGDLWAWSADVKAPTWRRLSSALLACAVFGCGIEPIPSISAPVDIVVSSLAVPEGPVIVSGRPGAVPAFATVTVRHAAAGHMFDVTADARGAFSARLSAPVGAVVDVTARVGDAVSPSTAVAVLSAAGAGVPAVPGASPASEVVVGIPSGGRATVVGTSGAVAPAAEVIIAQFPAVVFTRADSRGAFSVAITTAAGRDVAILAVSGNLSSPPLQLVVPAVAGELDQDGDGHPAASDCDDHDRAVHPGSSEQAPLVDDDCDGETDEADEQSGSDGTDATDEGSDASETDVPDSGTDGGADSADDGDSGGTDAGETDGTDATGTDGTGTDGTGTDGTDGTDIEPATDGADVTDSSDGTGGSDTTDSGGEGTDPAEGTDGSSEP